MHKVSIIMVTYGNERFIKKAVDSLLSQSFSDFELIIVWDRCSDDDKTRDIIDGIKDERIIFIENTVRKGLYHARNVGLDNCHGEYIINFDADDIAMPDMLETLVNYLDHYPCDCVASGMEYIDENGDIIRDRGAAIVYRNPGVIASMLLWQNAVINGGSMFRRNFINKYGIRYKEGRHAEDYMFWVDVSYNGVIHGIDKSVFYYRIHGSSGMKTIDIDLRQRELDKIRKYAYKLWGFILSAEDESLLLSVCRERPGFNSVDEIEDFIRITKIMISQAESIGYPYVEELKTSCRLRLAECIKQTKCIWE